MGIGGVVVGKVLPTVGFLAGAAALGGAVAYGSVRAAGDAEKPGTGMALLGMFGGNPLVAGGIGGFSAWALAKSVRDGALVPEFARLALVPGAIAGAWLGAKVARSGLEQRHQAEYDAQRRNIDESIEATREVFRGAGASEAVLDRVPEGYDRSYFNASYRPFHDDIRVGRSAETGLPLATNDVVAHEFTHKVLHQYAPGLLGATSGGHGRAIHESIADTFAVAVDTDDWTIAEDAVPGGIRSFSHPEVRGSFRGGEPTPGPITRDELEHGAEEHLAAGVGNKAAWRIGDALGRDAMVRIYVAALERRELQGGATYADLARVVRAAATDLYGRGSREASVVDDAWDKAGY
jgi:hypothetical protein